MEKAKIYLAESVSVSSHSCLDLAMNPVEMHP